MRFACQITHKRISYLQVGIWIGLNVLSFLYISPYLPGCDDLGLPFIPGLLACAYPGAGKRRIFAIGNSINQGLLKPIHDWAMSVLKRIPMDGTFNQTRPLRSSSFFE